MWHPDQFLQSLDSGLFGMVRDDYIPPDDLEVAERPDGSPVLLGEGSFGKVCTRHYQVFA